MLTLLHEFLVPRIESYITCRLLEQSLVSMMVVFVAGFFKEMTDTSFSATDLWSTIAGGAIGCLVLALVFRESLRYVYFLILFTDIPNKTTVKSGKVTVIPGECKLNILSVRKSRSAIMRDKMYYEALSDSPLDQFSIRRQAVRKEALRYDVIPETYT